MNSLNQLPNELIYETVRKFVYELWKLNTEKCREFAGELGQFENDLVNFIRCELRASSLYESNGITQDTIQNVISEMNQGE